MSILRGLMLMPFVAPVLAIAGIAYIADAALDARTDPSTESAGEPGPYRRDHHYPHGERDAALGVVTRSDCRVLDGDTLRCGRSRIRLLGIDAAELPGHCVVGRHCAPGDPFAHKRSLEGLMGKDLKIDTVAIDRWGRSVADVTAGDGTDLSCAMLAAGATYKPKWDNGYRIARTCPSRAVTDLWRTSGDVPRDEPMSEHEWVVRMTKRLDATDQVPSAVRPNVR